MCVCVCVSTCECVCIVCVCVCAREEMVDFGEPEKMIKMSGKVNKRYTYNGFSGNISFIIHRRTSSD